jgi:integrase
MVPNGKMSNDRINRISVGDRITIYPRGQRKVYVADFHYKGRHCRKSLGTTIKRIAMRRAITLQQTLDDGSFCEREPKNSKTSKSISLVNAAKEFVAFSETEGRRRRTVVKQRGILNRFTDFAKENGIQLLVDVDLRLVDGFRAFRKPDLKPKSMHNEGQLIKQFLGWCEERGLIGRNPLATRKFRPPKSEPRESPSLKQINLILKTASATRYPVLATLAFTGARSGEVAHLRVEDADLTGNWLHFVSRPGFETKTGESRKMPIHARLRPVLEQALACNKSGWLFTALPSRKFPEGGHYISTKRINEDFLRVLTLLKIPAGQDGGFTVHSFRRSFKTICVNGNIPREVVDAWQGHTRIRNASDLYYSLPDADSQRFMKLAPFGDTI